MARNRRKRTGAGQKVWQRGMRVILYLRVSDTRGREDSLLSPELQERSDRAFCEREGLVVVDVVTDLDKSGRDITKRQINATIRRVEAGEADGVVVLKVDRFGRNLLDSLLNIRELQDANGFLASATENLEDIESPMGRFSLTQMLAIAELQSDQIGEGWVRVHDYRRDQGLPHDGKSRFGYVKNDLGRDGDPSKVYTPDPLTGPWLRKCYEEFAAGKTFHALVAELNASGIRTVRGNQFTSNSLRATLDSGFGAGLLVDRRDRRSQTTAPSKMTYLPGAHEPVISEAVWEAYKRKRMEKVAPRSKSAPHKWATLLHCDTCKRRMVANQRTYRNGRRGRYFACQHGAAHQRLVEPCPKPASIDEEKLDQAVFDWLKRNQEGDDAFDTALARQQRADQARSDVGRIDDEIERLKKRLARLTDMLLDADEDDEEMLETFKERQSEIRLEMKALKAQRDDLSIEADVAEIPSADAFGALVMVWDRGNPTMVNEALRSVIGRIYIRPSVNGRWDDLGDRVDVRGRWEV